MLFLEISAFSLAVLPFILISTAFIRENGAGRRGAVISFVVFAAAFAMLGISHHRNYFAPLDAMCYRSLAKQFQTEADLTPPRDEISILPKNMRNSVFWRKNCPSVDAVFKYKTPSAAQSAEKNEKEAFETTPAFLPALPLAAAALGRFHELFTPLIGALWFTVVLLAASVHSRKWMTAACIAAMCTLFTCFPVWFFRDFHAEATGSALISASFALLLAKCGCKEMALAGFCLSFAAAFHLTMFLFALPIAVYAVTRVGKWKHDFALLAGLVSGIVPAIAELTLTGNPYFKANGLSDWMNAARSVPVIGAMIGLAVLIFFGGAAALLAATSGKCRAFFEKKAVSKLVKRLISSATVAVCVLPCANGVLGKGVLSVHPAMLALWIAFTVYCIVPLYRSENEEKSLHLAFFLLVCCGLFGFFVKGTEIEVEMWSFRRLMPFAVICAPVCAYGLSKLREKSKFALAAPAVLTVAAVMLSPLAWFGVNGRGAERTMREMKEALSEKDIVFSDYIQRSVSVSAFAEARVLGLNSGASPKSRDAFLDCVFSRRNNGSAGFVTSYEPCTLELGTELIPEKTFECEYTTIEPSGMMRAGKKTSKFKDTLLAIVPADGKSRQKKIFDGGPLGLRGEWKRANRGGCWCGEDAAIIGPVPAAGEAVNVKISAGWFDASGMNSVSKLQIIPPFQTLPVELEINGPRVTFSTTVTNAGESAETTGLWRFRGSAVLYEMEIFR